MELDGILALAQKEYEYEPPTWYTSGRAMNRLLTLKDYFFVCLDHEDVDITNNKSEQALRPVKRKVAQAVTFRSGKSVDALCTVLSITKTERPGGRRVCSKLRRVLARPKPQKSQPAPNSTAV